MKVPVENKILAGFIVTALALAGMGWLSYRSASDFISAQKWVTHTYEVISQLETTLALVIETDTEQRGYLLTEDSKYLAVRQAVVARIPDQLQQLQHLTADNPTQQQALKQLEALTQKQIALTDDRIATFQKSGLQAALAKEPMEKTEVSMNEVRALTAQMRSTETKLQVERIGWARTIARRTEVVVIAGSTLAVILGLAAVFLVRRDLRLRALAESKLHQNEERFRSMIAAVKDYSIVLLDPEGRVTTWNRGAERLNGYSAEEIIGKHFSIFYPQDIAEKGLPQQLLREATEQGRVEHADWHVRKDGSQFWANVIVTAALDAEGKLLGFVKVTRDLTEQNKAQEKIEKLNSELQTHASQLESANKELEAFSYSVSHDLRAPLRHIDGFVKMLDKHAGDKLDDRGHRYLDIIADSAQRMGALIDDLLVFSRMSRAELHHSKVSTDALVHEAVDGLQIDINERHINWNIGALPEADADPAMLQQVWVNLISNAR